MAKVQAAYDFQAQPGSGELTIQEGEILTIIRDNVDGGWIEGKNSKGKVSRRSTLFTREHRVDNGYETEL